MDRIKQISHKIFGFIPKEKQLETINHYNNGHDCITIAPTGWGKSLIYQIAPFILDSERYSIRNNTSSTTTTEDERSQLQPESFHSNVSTVISTIAEEELPEPTATTSLDESRPTTIEEEMSDSDDDLLTSHSQFTPAADFQTSTPQRPPRTDHESTAETIDELSALMGSTTIDDDTVRLNKTTKVITMQPPRSNSPNTNSVFSCL